MESLPLLRHIIFGQLRREFILPLTGQPYIDQIGGSLLYAATGFALWESDLGLVARVGQDFPSEWLAAIRQRGFDARGVKVLSEPVDQRFFCAFIDWDTREYDRPVAHFTREGLPFPKVLLNFSAPPFQLDSRTTPLPLSLRVNDLPSDYLDATAAHLCPLDFLAHTLIPAALRLGRISTITLDPSAGYMNPVFWEDIPHVVKGLSAFLVSEDKLMALFQGRSTDLWEMAETIASYGCDVVVVKRGSQGQLIYERASRAKWLVPAYPARVANPTGVGDAFCGGFLAAYRSTYNPVEGVLSGNISASLVIEGNGPFYALDGLPGLATARRDALREKVRKM